MRVLVAVVALIMTGCSSTYTNHERLPEAGATLHTFYYSWYMNPEVDGRWWHWNHDILSPVNATDRSKPPFAGGDSIGANFFPALGPYSSSDPDVMKAHAEMMVAAGIDNVVLSWWGSNSADAATVRQFADVLHTYDLTFSLHIEPFYSNIEEFTALINDVHNTFGHHPALFRSDGRPMYFLYDSSRLSPLQWQTILGTDSKASIRDTALDAKFIGLWIHRDHGPMVANSGFDGFYTYFAVDGFVYGSTRANWPGLADFAKQNSLTFIPCVGPGYRDDRIRPWNSVNSRHRDAGKYYDTMFSSALQLQTKDIAITSFNEWHEGTQIEPATHKQVGEYTYDNYSPLAEDYYIQRTRYWKTILENRNEQ